MGNASVVCKRSGRLCTDIVIGWCEVYPSHATGRVQAVAFHLPPAYRVTILCLTQQTLPFTFNTCLFAVNHRVLGVILLAKIETVLFAAFFVYPFVSPSF